MTDHLAAAHDALTAPAHNTSARVSWLYTAVARILDHLSRLATG